MTIPLMQPQVFCIFSIEDDSGSNFFGGFYLGGVGDVQECVTEMEVKCSHVLLKGSSVFCISKTIV